MPSSSPTSAPVSLTRAFADLAAAIDRSVSSDQAAELLDAFRTAVRAEAFREARAEIAADFKTFSKRHNSLSWGQAYYIARDGLCSCSGGNKPCDMGGHALRFFPTGGAS